MAFTYAAGPPAKITQAGTDSQSVSAIASGGSGLLDLTVTSSAAYSAGDLVGLNSTTSYNGLYFVDSIPDGTTIRISDTTLRGVQNAFGSTETGTVLLGDKDFSGLTGLTDVTVDSTGEATAYDIGGNIIEFQGPFACCQNGVYEQLIYRGPDENHDYHKVEISGDVVCGELLDDIKQYAYNFGRPCFIEDSITTGDQSPWVGDGVGGAGALTAFYVSGTGSLAVYGQVLAISGAFSAGSNTDVLIQDSNIFSLRDYTYSSQYNVLRVTKYTKLGVALVNNPTQYDQVSHVAPSAAYFGGSTATPSGTISIDNLPSLSAGIDALSGGRTVASPVVLIVFNNSQDGSSISYGSTSGRYYTSDVRSKFTVNSVNTSGTGLVSKTYYVGASGTGTTISHTGLSSEQTFTLRSVVQAGGTSLSSDTRYDKNQDGTDLIDLYTYAYGYLVTNVPNVSLKRNDTKAFDQTNVDDLLITETTKATVDAYTNHNTAQQIYDADAASLLNNFGTRLALIVGRAGNTLEIGTGAWTLSSLASGYNYATRTVQASTYTGGFSATTGSVTIAGATVLDGSGGRVYDTDVVYSSSATTITDINHTGAWDFTIAATYTIDGCALDEVTNSSGGAVILNLINGATVATNTGPNITVNTIRDVSITGIVNGSRLQIYNVTADSEFYNDIPGTSLTTTYNEGVEFTSGDVVRIRVAYQSGATAYMEFEATTTASANGFSALVSQVLDATYNTYGVDGSTITEFTWDGVNLQIDINDTDNTTVIQRIGAWYHYYITTATGIAAVFGGLVWSKLNEIEICTTCVDLQLDNVKASPLLITGGRLYRSDGSTVIAPASNSIQIDYEPVYVGEVTAANVTAVNGVAVTSINEFKADVSNLASQSSVDTIDANVDLVLADTNELQTNQGNWLTATGFATPTNVSDSQAAVQADIAALNDIAATDIVSAGPITTLAGAVVNVDTVDVTTTNSDMRGTDGANTIAPDNAGIAANGVAIAALNDFDPTVDQVIVGTNNDKTGYSIAGTKQTLDALNDIAATDVVSNGAINTLAGSVVNVDTVDTTTTNTDMRGTDGVPTNPLLSNDARIDNLDAAVSSRSTLTAPQVWAEATRTLTAGTRDSEIDAIKTKTDNLPASPAAVGSAMTLAANSVNSTSIQNSAITAAKIAANAITSSEAPALANLDATVSSRLASSAYTTPPTAAQIDTELTANHGAGTWQQANVAGLSTFDHTVDEVITDAASRNASKADVSAIETKAQADTRQTAILAAISALQNLSIADVETALSNYDAATGTEAAAILVQSTLARKGILNRFKINVNNTAVIYDDDGTTPLVTFDLKDISGIASYINSTERVPQ